MKVKELIALLEKQNLEAEVVINDNGSMLKTASVQESVDYNSGNDTDDFFIVTEEW